MLKSLVDSIFFLCILNNTSRSLARRCCYDSHKFHSYRVLLGRFRARLSRWGIGPDANLKCAHAHKTRSDFFYAAAALHFSSGIIMSIIYGPNLCALTRLASPRAWRPRAPAVQNCSVTKRGELGHNSVGRPERTYHTHKYYYGYYLSKLLDVQCLRNITELE